MNRKKQVLVIGDSGFFPEKNAIAYEVGKFIAQNGWVLVTGGRDGVMDAATKGSSDACGVSVAITPFS